MLRRYRARLYLQAEEETIGGRHERDTSLDRRRVAYLPGAVVRGVSHAHGRAACAACCTATALIDELARHLMGVRAGWFHMALGAGDDAFGTYRSWDRADAPARTASELVQGLIATWQG